LVKWRVGDHRSQLREAAVGFRGADKLIEEDPAARGVAGKAFVISP
jgi:hypothetical protein